MKTGFTIMALLLAMSAIDNASAQSGNDADRVTMRLRAVCNGGQGSQLLIAFDIKQKAGPASGLIGGFSIVMTFNHLKMTYQGSGQMYETGYWPGGTWYIDQSYGSGARFTQHTHQIGATGNSLPLNSTYFTPAADCSNNALNDGFFEVMRYQFQISPSAAGTVNFAFYNVLPYKAGQIFQHTQQCSAIYYSSLNDNGNDTVHVINNLVIPVELAGLSASAREDGSVLLTWRTESESSNAGFEIERGDGVNFNTVAFVEGQGNKTGATEYSFVDESAAPVEGRNVVFYRLRQIDTDGEAVYSHIVSANFIPHTVGLEQAYPNPVEMGVPVTIPYTLAVPGRVRLEVYDALGRRAASLTDARQEAGRYEVAWDGRDGARFVPAGVYFIRFAADLGNGEVVNAVRRISMVR